MGENFHGFYGFSLNCESFPVNHGLIDWKYKSKTMLQQNVYCDITIFHSKHIPHVYSSYCIHGNFHGIKFHFIEIMMSFHNIHGLSFRGFNFILYIASCDDSTH